MWSVLASLRAKDSHDSDTRSKAHPEDLEELPHPWVFSHTLAFSSHGTTVPHLPHGFSLEQEQVCTSFWSLVLGMGGHTLPSPSPEALLDWSWAGPCTGSPVM